MAIDLGDTVPLSTEILDANGALTAATGVVLTVTLPDGTTTTPAVSNPSVGLYTVDYVPTQAGRHLERWTSTNPATARTDSFDVRPAAPAYIISLADAKEHLNKTSTADDEELRSWLEATTEIVEELAGRTIARRVVTELHQFNCPTLVLRLAASPAISLTSITSLDGVGSWTTSQFQLDGEAGLAYALPTALPLYGLVQTVHVAGYASVPSRFTAAAKMILRHLWGSQRAGSDRERNARHGLAKEGQVIASGYAIPRAAADMIGRRHPMF